MAKRAHIGLKVKLAAALLALERMPLDDAKRLTADQICARYEFDHYPIPHASGGPDAPWNLVPMLLAAHREKTARVDIPRIAKDKRISAAEEQFRRKMLAKCGRAADEPAPVKKKRKAKIPSRPFPKRRRPEARQ